jgi:hypothetical protein
MAELPTELEVFRALQGYPRDMIMAGAAQALTKLTAQEALYLLAGFELARPRVYRRTVTENVATGDSVG